MQLLWEKSNATNYFCQKVIRNVIIFILKGVIMSKYPNTDFQYLLRSPGAYVFETLSHRCSVISLSLATNTYSSHLICLHGDLGMNIIVYSERASGGGKRLQQRSQPFTEFLPSDKSPTIHCEPRLGAGTLTQSYLSEDSLLLPLQTRRAITQRPVTSIRSESSHQPSFYSVHGPPCLLSRGQRFCGQPSQL